jgi:translocation and assembly module TamA
MALVFAGISVSVRADVEILGIEDPLLANALAHLHLDNEACDATERRIQDRYASAPDEIRTALQAYGYYDAAILSSMEAGEECWAATFDVASGQPVIIRSIDISIAGDAELDPAFTTVVDGGGLSAGEPLQHAAYEQIKRGLLDLARARGYVNAAYTTSRLDVYPLEYAADITLQFDSGPRYKFGDIELRQSALDEDLLERYFDFSQGDFYEADKVAGLYSSLSGSGYFSQVDVRPLAADPTNLEIPIVVELQPGIRQLLTYGVGYSTNTGPRFRLGRTNIRRNERGHQSGVNLQLSPVISELTLTYRLPYGDPRSEWLSFQAGIKNEDTETSKSDSLEFGVRRLVPLSRGWRHSQFLDYLLEDFTIGDQEGRSRLLMPGVDWTRIETDDTLRPSAGYRLNLEMRGAADDLGSDTSFVQAAVSAKWIWSMSETSRVLLRGEVGATWEDEFTDLPPSVRFFAGGDTSVRGYDFESLGPVDADGEVVGGSNLAVASVEYEYQVKPSWSVAAFVDSGDAFNGSDLEPKTGAGVGFRWQSPLGPIRFDVAKPLDGDDRDLHLHISLGPDL